MPGFAVTTALCLTLSIAHGGKNLNRFFFSKTCFPCYLVSSKLKYLNIYVLMKTYHYAVTDDKIGSIAAWLEFVEVCSKVDALVGRQKWEHPCCTMIISLATRVVSAKEGEEGEEEGDDVSKQHNAADPLSPRARLSSAKCSQNNAMTCDLGWFGPLIIVADYWLHGADFNPFITHKKVPLQTSDCTAMQW